MSDLLSIIGAAPSKGAAKGIARLSDLALPNDVAVFSNVFNALSGSLAQPGAAQTLHVASPTGAAVTGDTPPGQSEGSEDPTAALAQTDSPDGAVAGLPRTSTEVASSETAGALRSADAAATAADGGESGVQAGAVQTGSRTTDPAAQTQPMAGLDTAARRAETAPQQTRGPMDAPSMIARPPAVTTSPIPAGAGAENARIDAPATTAGLAQSAAMASAGAQPAVFVSARAAARNDATGQAQPGVPALTQVAGARLAAQAPNGQSAAPATAAPVEAQPPTRSSQIQASVPAAPPDPRVTPSPQASHTAADTAALASGQAQPAAAAPRFGSEYRHIRGGDAADGTRTPLTSGTAPARPPAPATPVQPSLAAAQTTPFADAALASADPLAETLTAALHATEGSARGLDQSSPPVQTTASARPEIARDIARQIAPSITAAADGSVDIALSPKELGHVRMSLSVSESGVTLFVSGERAETIELMRRHADDLTAAFREMGYENIAFSFGSGGDAATSSDRPAEDGAHAALDSAPVTGDEPGQSVSNGPTRISSDRGLDLRI